MPTTFIDTQAFFLAQGLLFVVLPLTAWSILAGRHDPRAVALWCTSGLMAGMGFVLFGLRGRVPDWAGFSLATALSYAAYLVQVGALQLELRERPPWIVLLAIGVLAMLGFEMTRETGSDARELFGACVRLAGALWLAGLAFRLARAEGTRSATLLGAVYVLSALAFSTRVAAGLGDWGQSHVSTALDYLTVNVAALLTALYANLGYVGLVLERSHAKERLQVAELARAHAGRLPAEQHAQYLDALRAARRETLNEAMPAMLHSIDAKGQLLAVSDTWLSKLGYTRAEVIGRPSTDFLTPGSREHARQIVLPEFFRTGRCDQVAYQMLRRDGSVMDVLLSAVLTRDEQGQPLRSLAVVEDVTEKLAREAELMQEQALRLQVQLHAQALDGLLAERTEMLHVIAHEVRQPLNNASAALQSAAAVLARTSETTASERLRRAQSVLLDVLSGLDNTLASAALLAGSGDAGAEDTDIDALIKITLSDIAPAERPRIHVERNTRTRTATMDMSLMRLALRNLLANALSYSAADAQVVLRISDSDDPLALILDVVDSGAGIEPALMPRLFERGSRGVQGDGKHGSGLGLYIVRRVMEMHGGRVEAVHGVGGGTMMRLWILQGGRD